MQNPYLKESFLYQVIFEKNTSIVEPEKNEYQGFTSYTEWTLSHLAPTHRLTSQSLTLNEELKDNSPYFLVSVIWDSSDSFNLFKSGNIQFIDVCTTFQQAQQLKNMINTHHQEIKNRVFNPENPDAGVQNENDFLLHWTDERNQPRESACPWNGYFDNIAEIRISSISLSPTVDNFLKMHL
jgi:hypothetical protein